MTINCLSFSEKENSEISNQKKKIERSARYGSWSICSLTFMQNFRSIFTKPNAGAVNWSPLSKQEESSSILLTWNKTYRKWHNGSNWITKDKTYGNNHKKFCVVHFDNWRILVFKLFVNDAPTFLYKKTNSRSPHCLNWLFFSNTLVFSVWAQSLHFTTYFSGALCV